MQRIMVDLPEPDGPQTTTRSCCPTVMLTSRSTCSAPYHLFTLSRMIAGWLPGTASGRSIVAVWLISSPKILTPHAAAQLLLEPAAVPGHDVAEQEIDRRQNQVDLGAVRLPDRL